MPANFWLIVALMPLIWTAMNYVFAFLTGWVRIGHLYAAPAPIDGERFRWVSGSMNGIAMSNIANLILGSHGVHMSSSLLFSIGKPPLLIPWECAKRWRRSRLLTWRYVLELEVDGVSINFDLPQRARANIPEFLLGDK